MVNHDALVRAFGDYARAVRTSNYDVGSLLYQLTDHVVDVLGADGAGVSSRMMGATWHSWLPVTATWRPSRSSRSPRTGPCHDAFRTGELVAVTDLGAEDRWPTYTAAARDAGARAVLGCRCPSGKDASGP